MGLDMYLMARRDFYDWMTSPERQPPNLDIIPQGRAIRTIFCEAAYWRKANHIHQWFVETCQEGNDDCGTYYVDREVLQKLRALCEEVIADPASADRKLPRQTGFFFGSYDYDEFYFSDCRDTIRQIDKALTDFPDDYWSFEYHSSW